MFSTGVMKPDSKMAHEYEGRLFGKWLARLLEQQPEKVQIR